LHYGLTSLFGQQAKGRSENDLSLVALLYTKPA